MGGRFRSALRMLVTAVVMLVAAIGHAVQPDEVLSDAAMEKRARALSAELRCLVCQNQSIDDSDAPLAKDLRVLVRERLLAGDSDKAVMAFIVDRYGDYVLLKPPVKGSTLLLWLAPLLILLGALAYVWRAMQAKALPQRTGATAPLSADEERRLTELLGPSDKP
jgi:cytochrome c-type biogenesis protein CcmH